MKAIGYARVSTDKQAEKGCSLEAQEEKVRARRHAGAFPPQRGPIQTLNPSPDLRVGQLRVANPVSITGSKWFSACYLAGGSARRVGSIFRVSESQRSPNRGPDKILPIFGSRD